MSLWKQSLRLTRLVALQSKVITVPDTRPFHRWVAPTLKELARRTKKAPPQPESPRSSYLEWNYDMEVRCFARRLGEKFDDKVLKEVLIQQEWANIQEIKARDRGDMSFIPPEHNRELAEEGHKIITEVVKEKYSKLYPSDVVDNICNYLSSEDMLSHIAKHLGMKDLVNSLEYPPNTKTMADSFKAVVAALSHSADPAKVSKFVEDFVISQMNGKDLYDVWVPEKPYDYLVRLLQQRGVKEVEPRLCNQSAVNTILANYQVGLYNAENKACLGLGWGENIQIAKDTAALDAIQKIFSS